MANTAQSKKRVRRNDSRKEINRDRISRVRTFVRKVEEAIVAGDAATAAAAFKRAEPEIMRGVTKGVLHRNTAARKVSRLAQRINSLNA